MNPLALHPKLAPAPPSAPPAHTTSAASGGKASFAAVLHGLDTLDVEAKIKGPKGNPADAQDSIANFREDSNANPAPSPSIEAALAALGYPSPAPSTAAAGIAPHAAAAPVAIAPPRRAAALTPPALAETRGAAAPQNALFADATLGLQSLRTRTHLALAATRPAPQAAMLVGAPSSAAEKATEPQQEPSTPSYLQTKVAPRDEASLASARGSAAGASPVSPRAEESPTAKSWAAPRTKGTAASRPGLTGARGFAPARPGSPGESDAASRTSGESAQAPREGNRSGGEGASPVASDAPLAPSNAPPGPATAGPAPIGINQLADFIAAEAASLTPESTSMPSAQTSANSAPPSVTELEIALDPADLGAVSIRMRYANGKLTVVIGAANASTRQAIESDRAAIAERLTSSQHPLEALIIHSADPTHVPSGGNDASDTNDPASAESHAGGGAPNGRGRSAAAALPMAGPASRGGSGDLTV